MTKRAYILVLGLQFLQTLTGVVSAGIEDPHLLQRSVEQDANLVNDPIDIEPDELSGRDSTVNMIYSHKDILHKAREKAEQIRQFNKQHGNQYNSDYCFLADMSVHSGMKRLFVYNMKTDSIVLSSLVSHGIGSKGGQSDQAVRFSNEPSSFQTSLGKYRVGGMYYGHFGKSFYLFGLESTNSKAYARKIVLHSHDQVPVEESYPLPIGESLGCPIVAPSVLGNLGTYIREAQKPILLWIYQ